MSEENEKTIDTPDSGDVIKEPTVEPIAVKTEAPPVCPYCGGKVIDHGYDCYSCERCHREFGPKQK